MPTTINASTSNGLVQSADGSGIIKLQSNGVTTNALAWVNFNGTGTVAIRSSYNVSSITDNGTGQYTVNFATALSDANYAVNAISTSNITQLPPSMLPTTTAVSIVTTTTTTFADSTTVTVTIHGN
jgi:hypothetical protein